MSIKREQLIQTAERLFYRDGYRATGIDRVIAEAGVARMTLYRHFPSKDDLVCATLQRRSEAYLGAIDRALGKAARSPGATAAAVLAAHGRWLSTSGKRGCMFMKAIGEYAGHAPRITQTASEHKLELVHRISRHVDTPTAEGRRQFATRLVLVVEGATTLSQLVTATVAMDHARSLADAWLMPAAGH